MTEPISTTRLAEIREADGQFPLLPSAASVYGHRRALLAEVDRLTTALAEAETREKSVRGAGEHTARELGAAQFERDNAQAEAAKHQANVIAITAINYRLRARLGATEAERDQARARVAELEAERESVRVHLAVLRNSMRVIEGDYRGFAAHMRYIIDAVRERLGLPPHPVPAGETVDVSAAPDRSDGNGPMPLDEAFDELRQLPGFPGWHDADGSGK
jgi:hypothetical protein